MAYCMGYWYVGVNDYERNWQKENTTMRLGDYVALRRKAKLITRAEMSEQYGITRRALAKLEGVKCIAFDEMLRVLSFLGVNNGNSGR